MNSASNNPAPDSASRSKERRREPRIVISIEIEVSGIDHSGKPFREVTRTIEVSEWGCSFRLAAHLDIDALAAVNLTGKQPYCLPDTQPVMFQVNYSKQDSGTWIIGASRMQAERLWDIDTMVYLPRS